MFSLRSYCERKNCLPEDAIAGMISTDIKVGGGEDGTDSYSGMDGSTFRPGIKLAGGTNHCDKWSYKHDDT